MRYDKHVPCTKKNVRGHFVDCSPFIISFLDVNLGVFFFSFPHSSGNMSACLNLPSEIDCIQEFNSSFLSICCLNTSALLMLMVDLGASLSQMKYHFVLVDEVDRMYLCSEEVALKILV